MTFTVPSNGMPYEERQAYLGVLYDPVFGVKANATPMKNPAVKRGWFALKDADVVASTGAISCGDGEGVSRIVTPGVQDDRPLLICVSYE